MADFESDKKEFNKSQLIWVVLGIIGILIIWLISSLVYK